MTRVCSQLTFCSPQTILRRTVVEQDENQRITRLFCLDDSPVESSQTLFFDGIISTEIMSLKQYFSPAEISEKLIDYQYIDVSENLPTGVISPIDKPLVLDFGDIGHRETSQRLASLASTLQAFTIYELIAACSYYPALVLNLPAGLAVNRRINIILWEGVDLVNKRITDHTSIRKIV